MTPAILLTRPARQSKRFAGELREKLSSHPCILVSPLLQIIPQAFDAVPDNLDVIFTSENAVAGFVASSVVGARRAFCVGDRTAEAAREAGFDALSAGGTAMDLIDLIAQEGGGDLIYAHGTHVSRDLSADLAAIGIPVHSRLVYAQADLTLSQEARSRISGAGRVIFPLFSTRSMELLCTQDIAGATAHLHAVCISSGVAAAAQEGVFDDITVCNAPNSRSMIDALRAVIA